MSGHDEARLIAAARAGDGSAFAELAARHQQALRGFLRRTVGHCGDADDLAQEAFVAAWSRLDRFEARSSFRTWVCGIGYRIARDAKRAPAARKRETPIGSMPKAEATLRRLKIASRWPTLWRRCRRISAPHWPCAWGRGSPTLKPLRSCACRSAQ